MIPKELCNKTFHSYVTSSIFNAIIARVTLLAPEVPNRLKTYILKNAKGKKNIS